jgi:hypothetical protein
MTDRTFSDPAIQRYISGKEVVVLAMLTSRGGPLATPMWFVNDGEQLAMVSVVAEGGEGGEGGESGAIGVVLAGEVRFLDGDERHKWGRRFREKYSPNIERLWGGQAIPDNRRVFAFAPRVASAFGL